MRISARADYAVRAAAELASANPGEPIKGERLAKAQTIPIKFLENILIDLKRAGIVRTMRGADGGYLLAKKPATITVADIIRAVDGPLAYVRDRRPEELEYTGAAEHLRDLWVALRGGLRSVLEKTTLADLVSGALPRTVRRLLDDPESWIPH